MNRWRKCCRFLCALFLMHETVTCNSAKQVRCKSGRTCEYTGVNFFVYRSNFDMIYDIHKVKLSSFLLLN